MVCLWRRFVAKNTGRTFIVDDDGNCVQCRRRFLEQGQSSGKYCVYLGLAACLNQISFKILLMAPKLISNVISSVYVQVQSSSLRLQAKPAPKEPFGASQKRSLLRIDNDSKGEDKVHDETKMLPVPILLNQILYGPNKKLNDGINRGLHDVGIFLLGWFVVMCAIGGVMRCYICCEHIQSGSFNIRSLYDSFADRELVAPTEDEEEGIALGSTHGTMNSESDYD